MNKSFNCLAIVALLFSIAFANATSAQIPTYNQNFEGLDINSPSVLDQEGWLVGAIVTNSSGTFLYDYFADGAGVPFPAPNSEESFSAIGSGSGGENQGEQYMNIFSDYANQDAGHAVGNIINGFVYQGGVIEAEDLNQTFRFQFDYRTGDDRFGVGGDSETFAYIRILSPAPDFFLIFDETIDTTNATEEWVEGASIDVTIADDLEGFTLQFGFGTVASNNEPSGIFYDNISFGFPADCVVGDLNDDGAVTLLDVGPFVEAITSGEFVCPADTNGDGVVDLLDVQSFISLLTGG